MTVERYRARLQRFIEEMGDCRISEITSEKLVLYKWHLMDAGLGPATIGGFLSCLRGFVRYLRDVRRLRVLDAEKIKRPRIPQRTVEYLTKEELNRLRDAIPAHTWNGLRDRALIEVLFSSGMRISEVLALDRAVLEWELRQAVIIGKGRKERKVYFSEEAIDWLTKYLSTRHDDYPAVFVTTGSRGLVNRCVKKIRRRPSRCPASPAPRRHIRRPRRPPAEAQAHPADGSSAPRRGASSR